MKILILSQVVLSFALPAAIIPLLLITSRKRVMGEMVNKKITNILGIVVVTLVISLNVVLIYLTFFITPPLFSDRERPISRVWSRRGRGEYLENGKIWANSIQ